MKKLNAQIALLLKRKTFILTLTFLILFSVSAFLFNCIRFYGSYINVVQAANYLYLGSDLLDMWSLIFALLVPIVAVVPFADSFYEERKQKTLEICLTKESNGSYYFSKLIAVFLSGFIVIAVPLVVNMLLNFVAFPLESTVDYTNLHFSAQQGYFIENILFKNLYVTNPHLYNFFYSILTATFGGLTAVIVFQFSFFYKSSRLFLICSFFIIFRCFDTVFRTFRLYDFLLSEYMVSMNYYPKGSVSGFLIVFSILFLTAVIPIPFAKKRLENSYD